VTGVWAVGDRVVAGEGDDREAGRIVSIGEDGNPDHCVVMWDQGERTPANLGELEE